MLERVPRRWKWFAAFSLITLVLDQLTKLWARHGLPVDSRGIGKSVAVIENFFDWRLSYNTGSAFGLFSSVTGARIFLTIVGVVALGAIGNVIDRVAFGKVTDFVVWKWYTHEWPTFNVADAALCVGVGLLFLDLGKQAKEEKARQDAEKATEKAKPSEKKKKK